MAAKSVARRERRTTAANPTAARMPAVSGGASASNRAAPHATVEGQRRGDEQPRALRTRQPPAGEVDQAVARRHEGGDAAVAVGVELEDQRPEDLAGRGDRHQGRDAASLVAFQPAAGGQEDEPSEYPEGQATGSPGLALEQKPGADERDEREGQRRETRHASPVRGRRGAGHRPKG
jgi:hypothetical protein